MLVKGPMTPGAVEDASRAFKKALTVKAIADSAAAPLKRSGRIFAVLRFCSRRGLARKKTVRAIRRRA